jgi:uncharacterized membrane protein
MCRYDKKYAMSLSYPEEEYAKSSRFETLGYSKTKRGVTINAKKTICSKRIIPTNAIVIQIGTASTNTSIIFLDTSTGFCKCPARTEPDSIVLRMSLSSFMKKDFFMSNAMIIPITYDMIQYDFILSEIMFGDMLIMAGAVFYAIDMNISKLVSNKISPVRISQISAFAGMVFAFLLVVSMGISWDMSWYDLPGILFLGVFSTGISSFLFVISLRLIGPVRAILIYCTANAFEMVFAWSILGESLETIHVMSLIIAVSGVMLLRHKIS